MRVFRLCRSVYAHELNGVGAAKYGNRWNLKGTEMIYTAESRALAMAEVLVHLPLNLHPPDYLMMEIEIPDGAAIKSVEKDQLPKGWDEIPPNNETQRLGSQFIQEGKFLVFRVPSTVVEGDHNYLINPYHPQFTEVNVRRKTPFTFDQRILTN